MLQRWNCHFQENRKISLDTVSHSTGPRGIFYDWKQDWGDDQDKSKQQVSTIPSILYIKHYCRIMKQPECQHAEKDHKCLTERLELSKEPLGGNHQ